MMKWTRFKIVFLVAVLFPAAAWAKTSSTLIAFDQLAASGHPVWIKVRLVSGSLAPRPVSGERIEFRDGDRLLSQSLSGGDGLASARFTPPRAGLHVISVRLADNPRYEAEPSELILESRAGGAPILIHLSSIQASSRPPAVPFSPAPSPEAMPEAAAVLKEISGRQPIVFLEWGPEGMWPRTRDWLTNEDFPKAPLWIWTLPPSGRADRLTERLDEIRRTGFGAVSTVITGSVADAEEFSSLGLRVILVSEDEEGAGLPAGVRRTTVWKGIPALLKRP
ncbi:MAG TPA: hypothetical protein VI702_03025 [Nitrospiria bacterium]